MEKKTKYRLSGVAAGLTNGIFGGGGGIPLLVLLTKWAGVEEKKAFATCVAVIFPMCAVSAALWYWRAELSLTAALPYLLGGFAGGLVAGEAVEWCLDTFASTGAKEDVVGWVSDRLEDVADFFGF